MIHLKKILFILSIFFSSTIFSQAHKGPIKWLSLEQADSLHKIQPKPLFIDVYTDWCGWCKRMDASTFQDPTIAAYLNSNFYPVKLNAETQKEINFNGKLYKNTQKQIAKKIVDSLTLDIAAQQKVANTDQNVLAQKRAQLAQYKRRARKTTHDVAIDLCRGKMSYPTFILLFGDDLKANIPLKGFQKPVDLLGYLSFVAEGIYSTTRDLNGYTVAYKNVFGPSPQIPNQEVKWLTFSESLKANAQTPKRTFVHIMHPNSIASSIMDQHNLQQPITANKINKNFHAVKLYINDTSTFEYKGNLYKNIQGYNQLALSLARNNLKFPQYAFLDEQGNLVMNVPQYFGPNEINNVLDYFIEEAYKTVSYPDWLKARK